MGLIRQGREDGWLRLPPEALRPWALLNGVDFTHVKPDIIAGRGAGLVATKACTNNAEGEQRLMTVPRDLILSVERVAEQAKVDKDYREVLESLGDVGRVGNFLHDFSIHLLGWRLAAQQASLPSTSLSLLSLNAPFFTELPAHRLTAGQTPRAAILSFLLVQCATASPALPTKIGVHSAFTDYIKTLPSEVLPTMWTVSELQLLVGTTLAPAISSKLKANRREYDLLCTSAANTRWYQAVQEQLDFDDWLQVDAMYRSRALDFPGIGHCMVPCVDLANHASHEDTVAIYEKDEDSNTVLLLRDGKTVKEGDEVTITYGDEKGACEMLFSYGFLEDGMRSAETLFLSLAIPHDDPQQMAKMKIADSAPGFKLVDAGNGRLDWNGEFIWLLCVNQEDGLRFQLARTVDGEGEEIHGFFGDHELTGGATELYSLLSKSELWDVYRLRAITILQQRVFDQLQVLYSTQEDMENVPYGANTDVRERPYKLAMKLRELEFDLLNTAYEDFEKQKLQLAESDVVKRYLAEINNEQTQDDDFS